MIRSMTENTENQKANDAIKRESIGNALNRTRQTHCRATLICPTKIDYKSKRRDKKKIYRERNPIKLCAKLTAKLLTTGYKSKIITFKLDEDPLQHRIYFLTFLESLIMIFSQYQENFEVLLDY